MRTISVDVTLYTFDELSEKAKERVINEHFADVGWGLEKEAMKSLTALAEHFCGKLADWSIDWYANTHSWVKFDMPDAGDIGNDNLPDGIQRAIGTSDATDEDVKAAYMKWLSDKLTALGTYDHQTLKGHGECKLTGVCFDESAIDGFRQAFMAGESDLDKLMQAAFKSWLTDCQADVEECMSPEQFTETCKANGYEFLKDGRISEYPREAVA